MKQTYTKERVTTCGIARNEEGKVLIAKREDKGSIAEKWEFPGGKNRDQLGETVADTLMREWKEELGLDIEVGPELASHEFTNKETLYHLKAHEVTIIGKPEFSFHVHTTAIWERLDRLKAYDFAPSDRAIIEQLLVLDKEKLHY